MSTTISNKTRLNRLKEAINILLEVPETRFNMKHWAGIGAQCKPNLTCGTSACALGWIASNPIVIKRGLKLFRENGGPAEPKYRGKEGFQAGSTYFGITEDESDRLFNPSSYHDCDNITTTEVIERFAQLYKHYKNKE